jgi:anti-sigma factor RsiW
MSRVSDQDLMALADGELGAADAAELRAAIADDATARAKLEALDQIAELIGESGQLEIEESLAGADPFAAMWERIEARITEPEPRLETVAEPAPEPRGLLAAVAGWLERHRGHVATGAVCAAAAAALVWFARPPEKAIEYVEVGSTSTGVEPAALRSQPPEVESLEVYDGSGIVLTIPGEDEGESTAVIWLTPPENPVEGPI